MVPRTWLKERRIFTQNFFHFHPQTIYVRWSNFLCNITAWVRIETTCIETSELRNVKPSTFTLYWIALTPRRKPYRIGIQMMIIAEVNENEREVKPTEKDINNQEWGLGFSEPNPLGSANLSARIFDVREQLVSVLFFDHNNNVEFVDLLCKLQITN